MSDDVPCQYCGEAYSPQGIHAHERYCDEAPEQSDEDGASADGDGARVFMGSSETETAVRERCDGCCERCETADADTFHKVRPDGDRTTQNLFALCADCDDELTGVHPITKRTIVRF